MKKLFTFLVLALCAVSAWGQDIIITRDTAKIEAIVLEISDTEVRYKKFSNQNGPDYILNADDIASIMFKNGDVQVFEQKPVVQMMDPDEGSVHYTGFGKYYYEGQDMNRKEFRNFVKANCYPAYQFYNTCTIIGYVGGLLSAGGLGVFCGAFATSLSKSTRSGMIWGGAICMLVGIPMCSMGFSYRSSAAGIYNSNCREEVNAKRQNTAKLNLDLRTSEDGIGVALRF